MTLKSEQLFLFLPNFSIHSTLQHATIGEAYPKAGFHETVSNHSVTLVGNNLTAMSHEYIQRESVKKSGYTAMKMSNYRTKQNIPGKHKHCLMIIYEDHVKKTKNK